MSQQILFIIENTDYARMNQNVNICYNAEVLPDEL